MAGLHVGLDRQSLPTAGDVLQTIAGCDVVLTMRQHAGFVGAQATDFGVEHGFPQKAAGRGGRQRDCSGGPPAKLRIASPAGDCR